MKNIWKKISPVLFAVLMIAFVVVSSIRIDLEERAWITETGETTYARYRMTVAEFRVCFITFTDAGFSHMDCLDYDEYASWNLGGAP